MLPKGFEQKMASLLCEEYPYFAAALERPRSVGLRINPLKAETSPALPFRLSPVPWEPQGYYYDPQDRPGLHPWHDAGLYYLQEPSAMAPVALLDPRPGEWVMDLCAAPGGKTTQIAGRMKNAGLLVCNEIHPKRARILSSNVERLGVANALVLNEHPAALAERFSSCFDRILVDAPCSGEGMFRKHDAACNDWSEQIVLACAQRQDEILLSAAKMLKPGGRLVYSTCTFSPEENEGSIERFLRRRPDFEIEAVDTPQFSPGRPDWVPNGRPELSEACRLWPHVIRGEGHFTAALRKKDGTGPLVHAERLGPISTEAKAFCSELGISLPEEGTVRFGQMEYLAPPELPCLEGLKVLRCGLELGVLQKGRFIPAHALALWLKNADRVLDLSPDGKEIRGYLNGQTLSSELTGWTLITTGGLSVGWGKGANGTMKNHYPKGLRRQFT